MKNLIETLKKETESLKTQYIEKTEKWAKEQVVRNVLRKEEYFTKKISDYSSKMDYYREQKFAYNTPSFHFTKEFVTRSIKDAHDHYEDSIQKLAFRIKEKGLDLDKLRIKTAHVGVNIESVLTDGTKTVRAFTILAWGDIQRPHYRYLIK